MGNFTEEDVQKVWEKGAKVPGRDANEWRKDQCGALIKRGDYGKRQGDYGWEIDHITPISKGGKDFPSNLRPLQWENNASRQDGRLVRKVTSEGNKNVKK